MKNHTSGPWVFDGEVNQSSGIIWSPSAQTRVATSHGCSRDEARANARLISAAPELLAKAKVVAGWIERVAEEVTMGPDDNKALNELRAAIRKAEYK